MRHVNNSQYTLTIFYTKILIYYGTKTNSLVYDLYDTAFWIE
ncbi:hypothetical protein BN1088_1430071 [Sphingobacterium sp. PM2-P1-29]|nr:hypothetical protein BN1088_1430071 [Sphingobacterium sp. PM2-P1-29]